MAAQALVLMIFYNFSEANNCMLFLQECRRTWNLHWTQVVRGHYEAAFIWKLQVNWLVVKGHLPFTCWLSFTTRPPSFRIHLLVTRGMKLPLRVMSVLAFFDATNIFGGSNNISPGQFYCPVFQDPIDEESDLILYQLFVNRP